MHSVRTYILILLALISFGLAPAAFAAPQGPAELSQLLSSDTPGIWTIEGENQAQADITVPHSMHRYGAGYDPDFESHAYTYRRTFDLDPAVAAQPKQYLKFGRGNFTTTVTLNGVQIGVHQGGFHAFEMDITDEVLPTNNQLEVYCEDYRSAVSTSGFGAELSALQGRIQCWDYFRGLYDDVWVVGRNDVYVNEFFTWGILRGDTDPAMQTAKTINARTEVVNTTNSAVNVEVVYRYMNGVVTEKELRSNVVQVLANDSFEFDMNDRWDNPRLWWPHDPFRYDVTVSIEQNSTEIFSRTFKFGFRDFYSRNTNWQPYIDPGTNKPIGDFWLNGERFRPMMDTYAFGEKIHKHELFDMWERRKTRQIFQGALDANINVVRLGGGAWPLSVIEIADELGMMVFIEAPLDGAHRVGGGFIYDYANLFFWNFAKWQIGQYVKEYRQHPSIVGWTLGNEVRFHIKPKYLKTDPEFHDRLASLADPIMQHDPSTREPWLDADLNLLHPFQQNGLFYVASGHYLNGATVNNRTETPNHEPWTKKTPNFPNGTEFFRVENDFPFGVTEYFWTSNDHLTSRAELFGGWAVVGNKASAQIAKQAANGQMAYHQTINYRSFRNWDIFGYFAADAEPEHLAIVTPSYRPYVAYLCNHNDAFYENQVIDREILVMNDSLDSSPMELEVIAKLGDGTPYFTQTTPLGVVAGEQETVMAQFNAPLLSAGFTTFDFEYNLKQNGAVVDANVRTYQLFPDASFVSTDEIYYLVTDTELDEIANLTFGPVQPLLSIDEIASKNGGIFLLRQHDLQPTEVTAIRTYLENGGNIVYFASDPTKLEKPEWLNWLPETPITHSKRPFPYTIGHKEYQVTGPVADALVDTDLITNPVNTTQVYGDLRFWGNDNLICTITTRDQDDYGVKLDPIIVNTDGKDGNDMSNVMLGEIRQGQGRVWYCTLLLIEKWKVSPPAAKVLSVLIEKGAQ